MSELLEKILAAKLQMRKELAALPFDKKLEIMEKMRERSALLAENALRKPGETMIASTGAAGSQAAQSALDEHKTESGRAKRKSPNAKTVR